MPEHGSTRFRPRRTESSADRVDADGIKLYTVSARDLPVDRAPYMVRLDSVKRAKSVRWAETPAFAIFHDGAERRYLVLAWWANGNELFTSVSVEADAGWVEDPARYSFCLWDLEIMWFERNRFVETVYCAQPSLADYRVGRYTGTQADTDRYGLISPLASHQERLA